MSNPQLPPLLDAGNALLAKVPCTLVTGKWPAPGGETGVLTIRTPAGETTVFLDKAEAGSWADVLASLRDSLSGSALVIPARGDAIRIADAARAAGNGQR